MHKKQVVKIMFTFNLNLFCFFLNFNEMEYSWWTPSIQNIDIICDLIVPSYMWPVKIDASVIFFSWFASCLSFIDSFFGIVLQHPKLTSESLTSLPHILNFFKMNLGRRDGPFPKQRFPLCPEVGVIGGLP